MLDLALAALLAVGLLAWVLAPLRRRPLADAGDERAEPPPVVAR